MSRRGRPPYPDVLTPREWEVLDLLRQGLTNQQIADRLGISLAGARYHVSEILSKLGVSSREEAASWALKRSVWAISPLSALNALRASKLSLLSWRIGVLVVALGLATSGVVGGAYWATQRGSSSDEFGLSVGRARLQGEWGSCPVGVSSVDGRCFKIKPTKMCAEIYTRQCIAQIVRDYSSVREASAAASFSALIPTYMPREFQPYTVRHTYLDDGLNTLEKQSGAHNDQIGLYYRDNEGHWLAIVEGFPGTLAFHESAPEDRRGIARVGDKEAYWVQGLPQEPWTGRQLTLYWEIGRFGSGWELSPDRGSVVTGSPMSVSISSTSLPLQELVAIAESLASP